MKAEHVEDVLNIKPFRPFTVEIESGKKITVKHMDFFILTPKRTSVIIFQEDDRFSIVSVENISAISFGE